MLGLTVISVEVCSAADLERAFQTVLRARAEILHAHGAMFAHQHPILVFAAGHRLPVIVMLRHWTSAGALITVSPNLRDRLRPVGSYVVEILNGAQPADLPVEQPTKFEVVVNLTTARALGLRSHPPSSPAPIR